MKIENIKKQEEVQGLMPKINFRRNEDTDKTIIMLVKIRYIKVDSTMECNFSPKFVECDELIQLQ